MYKEYISWCASNNIQIRDRTWVIIILATSRQIGHIELIKIDHVDIRAKSKFILDDQADIKSKDY